LKTLLSLVILHPFLHFLQSLSFSNCRHLDIQIELLIRILITHHVTPTVHVASSVFCCQTGIF
jgi:hypothetical protein